jgi:hypothetical protein
MWPKAKRGQAHTNQNQLREKVSNLDVASMHGALNSVLTPTKALCFWSGFTALRFFANNSELLVVKDVP